MAVISALWRSDDIGVNILWKKTEQQMKETGLSRALGGIEYEQDFSILVCWLHVIPSPTDIRAGSFPLFLSRVPCATLSAQNQEWGLWKRHWLEIEKANSRTQPCLRRPILRSLIYSHSSSYSQRHFTSVPEYPSQTAIKHLWKDKTLWAWVKNRANLYTQISSSNRFKFKQSDPLKSLSILTLFSWKFPHLWNLN